MIRVIKGDILEQDVDYIVNAANGHLRHGGGIARAIADAAGPMGPDTSGSMAEYVHGPHVPLTKVSQDWHQEQEDAPLIATGDAYVTSAGALPFKGIVHAVGPIWGDGRHHVEDLLQEAYDSAFDVAFKANDKKPFRIALPAISAGIFGAPIDKIAFCALSSGEAYLGGEASEVVFVLFSDEHLWAFRDCATTYQFKIKD